MAPGLPRNETRKWVVVLSAHTSAVVNLNNADAFEIHPMFRSFLGNYPSGLQ